MSTPRPGFARRLIMGMSGQLFARAIQACQSILLVPILIHAWGVDGFGQWITLTALTSYMGLSNFGLVTTSANEMVIASGAGQLDRARTTFQVSMNLAFTIVLPLIALIVFAFSLVPVGRGLNLTQLDSSQVTEVIALSGVALWLQTLRGLMVAALYAAGSYGFAYYLQGALKLIELGAISVAVLVYRGSQVTAAGLVAIVALVDLAVVTVAARRSAPWARFDFTAYDREWIVSQTKPAIGFLVSNLATQGFMVQGPRVALGALLGGPAVALYSIYSTAMRFVDQLLLTLVMPLEVEIAHHSGGGDRSQVEKLIVMGTHVSWALFVAVAIGLLVLGPIVFRLWTADRIGFSHGMMLLFVLLSAANLLGRVSLHALISTNRLYGLSFAMLGCAAVSVATGTLLTPALGVAGMMIGCIAGEAINSLLVLNAVAHWLGRSLREFLNHLTNFATSTHAIRSRLVALRD